MPTLTRFHLKASFIYLLLGLLMGIAMVLPSEALPNGTWVNLIGALRPVYLHLLILGWVGQLIFGVMYWMLPKHSKKSPRGNQHLGWFVFIALNLGLVLRTIGEPLVMLAPNVNGGWLLAASAVLLCAAGWGVVINSWQRVKAR